MSSQCGCRNTESVMTLRDPRYFAMEKIAEEQMALDDRGNQHQNSRVLPYRQNRKNQGKENNGKKSDAR